MTRLKREGEKAVGLNLHLKQETENKKFSCETTINRDSYLGSQVNESFPSVLSHHIICYKNVFCLPSITIVILYL